MANSIKKHYVYIIWEDYRHHNNNRERNIFKVTLNKSIAEKYCDMLNKKEKETCKGDYWGKEYFYSTHILTDYYSPEL